MKIRMEKAIANFLLDKQDLSPRTLEQYVHALDYLEEKCPKMPARPEGVRRALSQVASEWMKLGYWNVWTGFFRWCLREYRMPDPMLNVQRPKPPDAEIRALEPGQLTLLLAAAHELRDKAVVALALDCGIRASEFGRLRFLDLAMDTIRVWGKGRKQLRVPISPETHHLLRLTMAEDGHRGPTSLLFPGHNGKGISRFAVYRIVRRAMEKAGIPGPKQGPHALRHSLGMGFIADGGDAFSLKQVMRHRNIATTQKYVNLAMNIVIDQHHQHSPLRRAIHGAQGVLIRREVEDIMQDHDLEEPADDQTVSPRETG